MRANLEELLATADLPENSHVYGDKGYRSAKNEELIKSRKLKSRIIHKAKKGQPLTAREKLRNRLIGKTKFPSTSCQSVKNAILSDYKQKHKIIDHFYET